MGGARCEGVSWLGQRKHKGGRETDGRLDEERMELGQSGQCLAQH